MGPNTTLVQVDNGLLFIEEKKRRRDGLLGSSLDPMNTDEIQISNLEKSTSGVAGFHDDDSGNSSNVLVSAGSELQACRSK